MRLERITITNFKGLRDVTFEPSQFGCLVGENNAGKSSVLQALVFALTRPSQLAEGQSYAPDREVKFTIRLSDISDADLGRVADSHRLKISELLTDDVLTLGVKYPPGEKVGITALRSVPREQRFRKEAIDNAFAGRRGAAAIMEVIAATYPEFVEGAPAALTSAAAKAHCMAHVAMLEPGAFETVEVPLPSGIGSSISQLLPEPIYIPAVRNLNDELKTTQSTSFGRLLGLLLEDMTPDLGQFDASLATLNSLLNRLVVSGEEVDQRHTKVRELEALIEGLLVETFPRVRVELRVPPPELKTILNAAQIVVDDGSRDLIENKGDGIRRSLTFALLQAYVHHLAQKRQRDLLGEPAPRPLLFLFEEPELYLHPKSQRVLFDTLARLSASHQVVVTTHSPLFFAPGITASFVRIAKRSEDPKPIAVLHPINLSLDQANAEAFRLARFENADAAFFCRRVVLFEGESDDSYAKHIAWKLDDRWNFDQKNVAMVRVSGKGNFAKYRRFFEAFGIEVVIVADLDAMFEGFKHLGATAESIRLRDQAIGIIDGRIADLGITAELSSRQIRDRVQQESWRTRYENAKQAFRSLRDSDQPPTEAMLNSIDQLFMWEQDVARVRACREDDEALAALIPVLDALREQGICILSKGAIEDYYPLDAPTTGPKPDRAIAASSMIRTNDDAKRLSRPLAAGRECELVELFGRIFRDL